MKTLDGMLSRNLLIREQHAELTQPPGAGPRTLMRALASGAPLAAALAARAWAGTAAAQPNPAGTTYPYPTGASPTGSQCLGINAW